MIDIHCHIVPNIDDGAKNLDDALEIAKNNATNNKINNVHNILYSDTY